MLQLQSLRIQLAFFIALHVASCLRAQTAPPDPVLHRRSYNQNEEIDFGTRSTGRTVLPMEASGEYTLGSGEVVDVELQPDRLSGFITRFGDRESDQGTPLTFFFATTLLLNVTRLSP